MLVFVGTYSKGIHAFQMDPTSGSLTPLGQAADTPSPSYLAIHSTPQLTLLAAVNETSEFEGRPAGAVTLFQVDPRTGKLKQVGQQSS
ncbi:lactonase family protein, partial [Clostridium perfringens]